MLTQPPTNRIEEERRLFVSSIHIWFLLVFYLSCPVSSQTICQKTPDKTAEYFAAVWALHAISKVQLQPSLRVSGLELLVSHCCFCVHSW